MKVAIVTTRHGCQDDRIYFKEALSLAKRMDVTMIAPDDSEDLTWADGVSFRPIPRRTGPFGRIRSLGEAIREVRREHADVCHFHDLDVVLAAPILKLLTRCKLIFDSHEAFPEQFLMDRRIPAVLRPLASRVANLVEKSLVRFCDHVIAADEPTRRSFDSAGVPATTVFNYPALEIFETESGRLERERNRYRDRIPLIYQGSVSVQRGLFHMIDALRLLKRSEPRILLRIVGLRDPRLKALALEKAAEAEVIQQLEIVEWLPHLEISYAMKSSLIGLVPWQPEEKHKRNIPIKIFEYMACGLPIVAADLPSIAPYVKTSGAGVLYDSTRPEELADCVASLIQNPEQRQQMGRDGERAVRDLWNWVGMENVLFDVYESFGK